MESETNFLHTKSTVLSSYSIAKQEMLQNYSCQSVSYMMLIGVHELHNAFKSLIYIP